MTVYTDERGWFERDAFGSGAIVRVLTAVVKCDAAMMPSTFPDADVLEVRWQRRVEPTYTPTQRGQLARMQRFDKRAGDRRSTRVTLGMTRPESVWRHPHVRSRTPRR